MVLSMTYHLISFPLYFHILLSYCFISSTYYHLFSLFPPYFHNILSPCFISTTHYHLISFPELIITLFLFPQHVITLFLLPPYFHSILSPYFTSHNLLSYHYLQYHGYESIHTQFFCPEPYYSLVIFPFYSFLYFLLSHCIKNLKKK